MRQRLFQFINDRLKKHGYEIKEKKQARVSEVPPEKRVVKYGHIYSAVALSEILNIPYKEAYQLKKSNFYLWINGTVTEANIHEDFIGNKRVSPESVEKFITFCKENNLFNQSFLRRAI